MAKVKLEGLNIYRARGKWYVYRRATGEPLIKGFAGDRADLDREMAKSAFVAAYNRPRQRAALLSASDLPMSTLGGLVFWFTNGDIDRKDATAEAVDDKAGYPKWKKLAAATRKDYLDAFDYLRPEFDIIVTDITQSDLYDLRDKCAQSKWARFADQMISALSTMFTQGVKRGNRTGMTINPCRGMDKAHAADPNANREWFKNELPVALELAPHGNQRSRSCLPDTAVCADKASWSRDGNSISRTILPDVLPLCYAKEPARTLPSSPARTPNFPRRPRSVFHPHRGTR